MVLQSQVTAVALTGDGRLRARGPLQGVPEGGAVRLRITLTARGNECRKQNQLHIANNVPHDSKG